MAYSVSNCFFQDAEVYAKENNLLFMETSAKTALNVNDLFLQIGRPVFASFSHFAFAAKKLPKKEAQSGAASNVNLGESSNQKKPCCGSN